MLAYPAFDPIALQIGPIAVRWYGLMYLFGFLGGWLLGRWRLKQSRFGWNAAQMDDVIFYIALGVVLGGRLGYVAFYTPWWQVLPHDPLMPLRIWEGGMAFHGGLIGVLIALWLFGRHHRKTFFETTDFIAPLIAPGLFFGRLGNFINGELWGRVTDVPWGMVFPNGGPLPRHPSQLYQAALEGLLLFILVWWFSAKPRPRMAVSAVFLVGYGTCRFIGEFYRQPDLQLGFIAFNWLTMGQLLSLPMIVIGLGLLGWAYRRSAA